MPTWVQVILAAAAVVTSLGVLWSKVGRPLWRVGRQAEVLVPMLGEFTEAFHGTPQVFAILDEMVREFRTDSGSSLRDVINRLEALVLAQTIAGEAARQLSQDDRQTLARAVLLLDLLGTKADQVTEDRAAVAADLVVAEAKVAGVADDLAAAQVRADATDADEAGAAADAASRSADEVAPDT